MTGSAPACRSTPTRSKKEKAGHACSSNAAQAVFKPSLAKKSAQKWLLAQTSRGGHNATKSTDHPEYGLAFQHKPTSAVQQGEIPRTDVIANSLWLSSSFIIHTNLAVDKLGPAARMVVLISCQVKGYCTEVSRPPTPKEPRRSRRREQVDRTLIVVFERLSHDFSQPPICSVNSVFSIRIRSGTRIQRWRNHFLRSSIAPSQSSVRGAQLVSVGSLVVRGSLVSLKQVLGAVLTL